ncbi:MAG: sugar kinase, partial [Planctomycetaceae bacterium]
ARLGIRSAVAGRIGTDPAGEFVRASLQQAGVDTSWLRATASHQTSSTLVINVRGEDRRFIHAFGANATFTGEEIPSGPVGQVRVLYLGGFFLMPALSGERVARLFETARAAGVTTVLDVVIPNPANTWPELARVLPYTDVFLPNFDEAVLLTDLNDPAAQAQRFRNAGAATVVITCGKNGAFLQTTAGCWRSAVFPVEYVDGTGSGDAFAAGYIAGLLEGAAPLRCLELGSALGASCVRRPGATTGVFTRRELDSFLERNRLRVTAVEGPCS